MPVRQRHTERRAGGSVDKVRGASGKKRYLDIFVSKWVRGCSKQRGKHIHMA